jgi:hypothetical protein
LPDGLGIFRPKITIWVHFGDLAMEDVGVFYVCAFGLFYGHLIFWYMYGVVIWYIFPRFGKLYRKNLATLNSAETTKNGERTTKKTTTFVFMEGPAQLLGRFCFAKMDFSKCFFFNSDEATFIISKKLKFKAMHYLRSIGTSQLVN